jgi:hypothetical protein
MAFTFISHGSRHLEIASDDKKRFRFGITRDEQGRSKLVCEKHWDDNGAVDYREASSPDAARFASVCARDFGLM